MHPLYADKIRRVIRVEEPLEGRDGWRKRIIGRAVCVPAINKFRDQGEPALSFGIRQINPTFGGPA